MRIWIGLAFVGAPAFDVVREHGLPGVTAPLVTGQRRGADSAKKKMRAPSASADLQDDAERGPRSPRKHSPKGPSQRSSSLLQVPAAGTQPAVEPPKGNETAGNQTAAGGEGDVLEGGERVVAAAEQAVAEEGAVAAHSSGQAASVVVEAAVGAPVEIGKELVEGNFTAVESNAEGEVAAMFWELKPCAPDDLGSCLKKTTLAVLLVFLSYMVFVFQCMGRRLSPSTDEALGKEAFTGDMQPVNLGACPGGAGSKLCLAAYFCNCWLRLETLAKLEGWDAQKQNVNSIACVFMFAIFHLFAVTIVMSLGFSEHNQQDISALGLISAPVTMTILGYKLAYWRVKLKQEGKDLAGILKGPQEKKESTEAKEGEEEEPVLKLHGVKLFSPPAKEVLLSACCGPCAGGQEIEFLEKYEETFEPKEW